MLQSDSFTTTTLPPSIKNGGLYCGHPEQHQRRSGYQTGSPQLYFFNRTEEEVTANMEESRELDEQWAPQKKTWVPSAEEVGLVLNIRIVHNNLGVFEYSTKMTLSNFIFLAMNFKFDICHNTRTAYPLIFSHGHFVAASYIYFSW